MRKTILAGALLMLSVLSANAQWKPAGDKIKTQWATQVNPESPLPEYPRPMMVRKDWKNLNGLWNYAITDRGRQTMGQPDGKILVPFAVESSLSGVQRKVGKDKDLWYETSFTVPSDWSGRDVILHFGAVDFQADVFLNGMKICSHEGGYGSFSVNISPYLTGSEQKLAVRVWDPTTDGIQAVGKQRTKEEGIWYTPVTGIWQTVWLEPVAHAHITQVVPVPDVDQKKLTFRTTVANAQDGNLVRVTVKDGTFTVGSAVVAAGQEADVAIANPKLWSPESPFLYDVKVELLSSLASNQTVDEVESYAAMRKISTKRGDNGIWRLQLNNKDYFQFGPLDQGYWPDGLYTAPTDEALAYDVKQTKDYGFNMIRKHMKVEPARWYYWCDRLGVLVWQDMPSSDFSHGPSWQNHSYYDETKGNRETRSDASKALYFKEWNEIIDQHIGDPCIVAWTPFNEAWGQFDTEKAVSFTKAKDPTRLVNTASGGNHFKVGDMLDLHNYPGPFMYLFDYDRPTVLGEFGGLGLPLKGHLWFSDRNWGYVQFKNQRDLTDRYVEYAKQLVDYVKQGFAAAVYTQTTDVEGEVNGLMTYDRKVEKLDKNRVKAANLAVIAAGSEK